MGIIISGLAVAFLAVIGVIINLTRMKKLFFSPFSSPLEESADKIWNHSLIHIIATFLFALGMLVAIGGTIILFIT